MIRHAARSKSSEAGRVLGGFDATIKNQRFMGKAADGKMIQVKSIQEGF